MDTLSLIVHVTAAVLLVGPQVLLFVAVVPSTWLIDDERLRRDVTRVVTARYGMIAMTSLLLVLVTGLYQVYFLVPEPIREEMVEYRFGSVFILKMTLFLVLVGLIGYHTLVLGPRIRRQSDAVIEGSGDEGELESARRTSLVVSLVMVLVSLGLLVFGVMLGHHEFSYAAV